MKSTKTNCLTSCIENLSGIFIPMFTFVTNKKYFVIRKSGNYQQASVSSHFQ